MLLKRSTLARCWIAETCVRGKVGEIRFEHIENGFISKFVAPTWSESITCQKLTKYKICGILGLDNLLVLPLQINVNLYSVYCR